jgi:hypothetical protein
VLTITGKRQARRTDTMLVTSPIPNQRMNSGTSDVFGSE